MFFHSVQLCAYSVQQLITQSNTENTQRNTEFLDSLFCYFVSFLPINQGAGHIW